jgi:hypothetical protein
MAASSASRLRGLRRHLAPTGAASMADPILLDMYGNHWHLHDPERRVAEALLVNPAGAASDEEQTAVPLPTELAEAPDTAIAVDDNGFVWACTLGSRHLFRLNPRGPGYNDAGAPAVFRRQQRYSADTSAHTFWQQFDPAALPAPIVRITSSLQGFCAIVTLSDGIDYEVSIDAEGRSLALVPPGPPAGSSHAWRTVKARLPCGNHGTSALPCSIRQFICG